MQKGPVGRPKKVNPIKSGQLKEGEVRYTFITTKENIDRIKREASQKNQKIKVYLKEVLNYYWKKKNDKEELLIQFINKKEVINGLGKLS
jgi:hypothetical protein